MTKYMVSKYCKRCHGCSNSKIIPKDELIIVKFDAKIAQFGVGTCDVYINCLDCGRKTLHRIDTWWGGIFTNKDVIYNDTAKKIKVEVSKLPDVTNHLLNELILTLIGEIAKEKKELDDKSLMLKRAQKTLMENNKGKKKNG